MMISQFALLADLDPKVFIFFNAILGLIIGSCLSMISYRLPIMLYTCWRKDAQHLLDLPVTETPQTYNLWLPASGCTHCQHPLSWFENIPVFSWLLLKGRCRYCHTKISIRYPLIEIFTAFIFVYLAYIIPLGLPLLAILIFSCVLILLSVIDLEHYLLPDQLTLSLLWTGLFVNIPSTFAPLPDAVLGAITGYLSLWSLFWGFKWLTGKEGLGYGDFKLFAALGAWLGWSVLPLALLMAAIFGLISAVLFMIYRRSMQINAPVPFGPSLACAGWIMLLWRDVIESAYLKIVYFFYV